MNTSPKMYLIYELKKGISKVLTLVERNNQRMDKLIDKEYQNELAGGCKTGFWGKLGVSP